MGLFTVQCELVNPADRSRSAIVPSLLVDTGSELTWIPKAVLEGLGIARVKKDVGFPMANGGLITRSIGFAIVRHESHVTVDEVVFAEDGDVCLLGARTLEGMNVTVEPQRKRLVAAGPIVAASARNP
jgi:predicted aspartyl protease